MRGLWTDVRYGARMLRRTPSLSLVSIATIAAGIALSTFTFGFVYGSLWRGLPVRDAGRLVILQEVDRASGRHTGTMSAHGFRDFAERATSFEALAAVRARAMNLAGDDGPPQRVNGALVSANGLDILGVPPLLGGTFVAGDGRPGAPGKVVLGYDLWRTRFGAEPGLVGRAVRVDGEEMTIAGVMPDGFAFPVEEEMWIADREDASAVARRRGGFPRVYGYLDEGVSFETANAEARTIADTLQMEFPDTDEGISASVVPYHEVNVAGFHPVLYRMLGAVLLVLLIACANVAHLLLARSVLRTREIAVRAALGAGRGRIARQLLVEAGMLSACGGAFGIALAHIGMDAFNGLLGNIRNPYWGLPEIDAATLGAAVAAICTTAVIAGTVPALRAARGDAGGRLRAGDTAEDAHVGRLGRFLVVGELAASCALMIAAGLMITSIVNASTVTLGFAPEGILTGQVSLPGADYPTRAARQRTFAELHDRLGRATGVEATALASALPSTGASRWTFAIEGVVYADDREYPASNAALVGAGYFGALGVQLLAGRELRRDETFGTSEFDPDADTVAVVNSAFAARFFPDGEALGRRIRRVAGDAPGPWLRIVGIVPDLYVGGGLGGLGADQVPAELIYAPIAPFDVSSLRVVVRAAGNGAFSATDARRIVAGIDPDLPLYDVKPMTTLLVDSRWALSVFGLLFVAFGVSALLLAAAGLYGMISFAVAQRRREVGVRLALGARPAQIRGLVMRRVVWQLAIGLGIGMSLAYNLSGPLRTFLYGLDTDDPGVYLAIAGVLSVTALIAAWFPARRASRVDPLISIRAD